MSNKKQLSIDWKLTRPTQDLYRGVMTGRHPVIVSEGGARSGKTYGAMQVLSYLAMHPPEHLHRGKGYIRISVVSRSLPHIKKGAFRDFETLLGQGLMKAGEMRWTDLTFKFSNGSYIEFFGLEDPDKAHGPGRDILFINEANFIGKDLYDQLAIRTTGQILCDLNPSDFNCWVYEEADNPENLRIHSTYKDNLENLSPKQVQMIESLQNKPDKFKWKVYGLGERGASEELIFRHQQVISRDAWPAKEEDVAYGLDFGFTHPAAMVKGVFVNNRVTGVMDVYLKQEVFEAGLSMTDLTNRIMEAGTGMCEIYCDGAEPKSIQELYDRGLNVHPADKDDVWATIMKMKDCNLFIHEDSADLIRQMRGYKWKTDKDGKLLEEPVKHEDDAVDACRYLIFTHLNNVYVSV
jgi:phage terminase large subunit